MQRTKRRKKTAPVAAAEVIAALQHFGATFRFSTGGSLFVCGLAQAPGPVVNDFMECDQRSLVAAVRGLQSTTCSSLEATR